MATLRVYFLPDYGPSNPYQTTLRQSLERRGVVVEGTDIVFPFPVLQAVFSKNMPDVVHFHWTERYWLDSDRLKSCIAAVRFVAELLFLRCLGVRIVWTVHNLIEHERRYPDLERVLNQYLVACCHKVITHCRQARKSVVETYRLPESQQMKIEVIPHGHYLDTYENRISRQTARESLNLSDRHFVFLYFGRIRDYKGLSLLVDVFQNLESNDYRLIIAGNPTEKYDSGRLRSATVEDERIKVRLEFIPAEEVQVFMNAADFLVFPFQEVLTSGSVMLGMSFGRPIIAPRMGCIPEMVPDGGGLLFDPDDPDKSLKMAMLRATKAPLENMERINFERARQLEWETVAADTYFAYRDSYSLRRGFRNNRRNRKK